MGCVSEHMGVQEKGASNFDKTACFTQWAHFPLPCTGHCWSKCRVKEGLLVLATVRMQSSEEIVRKCQERRTQATQPTPCTRSGCGDPVCVVAIFRSHLEECTHTRKGDWPQLGPLALGTDSTRGLASKKKVPNLRVPNLPSNRLSKRTGHQR